MAALFKALTVLPTNGPGPAEDVSDIGVRRTFIVEGDIEGIFLIEGRQTDGAWVPVLRYDRNLTPKIHKIDQIMAEYRVTRDQVPSGAVPSVVVSGEQVSEANQFNQLIVPPAQGTGPELITSTLQQFLTIVCGNEFGGPGQLFVEGSLDGNSWQALARFNAPNRIGFPPINCLGNFARMRVRRVGTVLSTDAPDIRVGAGNPISGLPAATVFVSPMVTVTGDVVNIDNAKVKTLVDAATIIDITANTHNGFRVTIAGNRTFAAPSSPAADGEKITFAIQQDGVGARVPVWTTGAGGYRFANAASPAGTKLADVNALFTAAPANSFVYIGFQWNALGDRWECLGTNGYFP